MYGYLNGGMETLRAGMCCPGHPVTGGSIITDVLADRNHRNAKDF